MSLLRRDSQHLLHQLSCFPVLGLTAPKQQHFHGRSSSHRSYSPNSLLLFSLPVLKMFWHVLSKLYQKMQGHYSGVKIREQLMLNPRPSRPGQSSISTPLIPCANRVEHRQHPGFSRSPPKSETGEDRVHPLLPLVLLSVLNIYIHITLKNQFFARKERIQAGLLCPQGRVKNHQQGIATCNHRNCGPHVHATGSSLKAKSLKSHSLRLYPSPSQSFTNSTKLKRPLM